MATSEVAQQLPDNFENAQHERRRLLGSQSIQHEQASKHDRATGSKNSRAPSSIILYFMTIHFLLAFCEMILVVPLIKLFENSLCLSHYGFPAGGVEESQCKIHEIQGPLAKIRGWKSSFDTIPVLLVAIPIGKLGDHYGRRRIMAMSLFGVAGSLFEIFIVCAFPKIFSLQLVWLSSILLLCGGGLNSASAFMWAMASQSIPAETRSHAFYYIFSAFYVAEMVASYVASITIDISPWIPCGLAMGSVLLNLNLLAVMPDTTKRSNLSVQTSEPFVEGDQGGEAVNKSTSTSLSVDGFHSVISNPNILFIIPVFLVGIFRYTTLNVLIQYASVRFGSKISDGATFYTETALINIFLFLFLVPRLTVYVHERYKVRPEVIDLFLVRTSVCLMSIGTLVIGVTQVGKHLSIGVAIFAAGFGSRVSALSLISYWIPDNAKATIYASITVLESLGHAIGDPSMFQILAASLKLPPFWQALPFFVAAAFYSAAAISATCLRVEKGVGFDGEAVFGES